MPKSPTIDSTRRIMTRIATINPRAIHVDRRDGCSSRSASCKSAGRSNPGDIHHLTEGRRKDSTRNSCRTGRPDVRAARWVPPTPSGRKGRSICSTADGAGPEMNAANLCRSVIFSPYPGWFYPNRPTPKPASSLHHRMRRRTSSRRRLDVTSETPIRSGCDRPWRRTSSPT